MRYRLKDPEELMEFMWLRPNVTGLNVDLFVDDGSSYLRHNHALLLFARNGYEKENSFIPFSISSSPEILDDVEYKISYKDIFEIKEFIASNVSILEGLADEKISQNFSFKGK